MRTWPRRPKAPAVTEIARESISASVPMSPERNSSSTSLASSRSVRSPSIGLIKKGAISTRSLPADATTTRVNISSARSASVPKMPKVPAKLISNNPSHDSEFEANDHKPESVVESQPEAQAKEPEDNKEGDKEASEETADASTRRPVEEVAQKTSQQQIYGWSSWLWGYIGDGQSKSEDKEPEDKPQTDTTEAPEIQPHAELATAQTEPKAEQEEACKEAHKGESALATKTTETSVAPRRSWLQLLTGSGNMPSENKPSGASTAPQETQEPCDHIDQPTESPETVDTRGTGKENEEYHTQEVQKPTSGWIFWSKERPGQNSVKNVDYQRQEAIVSETPKQEETPPVNVTRANQETPADIVKKKKKAVAQGPSTGSTQNDAQEPRLSSDISKQPPPSITGKTQRAPNQVLPSLRSTFHAQEKSGFLQQLNRWLYTNRGSAPKHVSLTKEAPRITKALAIGVHGYFPAPLLRTVLGQPTGTSVRFSTQAAKAIAYWADLHGFRCEVEKIALEGEGHIEERVDLLWKLLLNWIDHIKTADFILIACHSQGVPVATMLVSKLIESGYVNSARIGVCAMAGVNLGPFPDFRSRWISGSAGELFDFSDPKSKVSQDLQTALRTALDFGVRITYVGSIDDQLVSLEVRIIYAFIDQQLITDHFLVLCFCNYFPPLYIPRRLRGWQSSCS